MLRGRTSADMKRLWEKRRAQRHGHITVKIHGPLADKIRALSVESGIHDARAWCREALEFMLSEHRSGRFRGDPDRHAARNGD